MNDKTKKRIFFVDDEPQVRKAVRQTLARIDDARVLCLPDAESCIKELWRQPCDLVVADVSMPDMDGLELLEEIKRIRPRLGVLLVTGYGDVPMAVKAVKAGAIDFIEKPLDDDNFVAIVKDALEKSLYKEEIGERNLTNSEIVVLRQVVKGKSNKEIAFDLRRSVRTIENHRHRLMRKLGVRNTAELVRKALKMGYATIDD